MQTLALALTIVLLAGPAPAGEPDSQTASAGLLAPAGREGTEETRAPGKDKKKKRKKKKKKSKSKSKKSKRKEAAPEWKYRDTPFGDFIWLARQLPDFTDFGRHTKEITLSIVAPKKGAMLFMDSCRAVKKKGWRISDCKVVRMAGKKMLGRLVKAGTDTSASPDSLARLKDLLRLVRRSNSVKSLKPGLMESSVANRQGYQLLDDVEGDIKECGKKRYFRALGSLPTPKHIGPEVVVVDLGYVVERESRSFKVKASLAKTKNGWRVGGLRVKCF